eukprot:TRINITY_DN37298_c0_g1_i1.p1 TRINITY_DN37298_c0_g1~~TRINITY_DN37298_c0_g1_i1.p1  ORF type:complete len:517 (+),score=198.39 TRINITY_DN37298_c0_g1_i1:67-1551(+)
MEKKPSTVPMAIANLINAVLGAGIVSLPYAWAEAGFILGWVMFIFTAVFTCYTLELLIYIADPLCRQGEIPIVSYEVLAERILGQWGKFLVIFSQFLFAFGISVGYVVIIHDELPTSLSQILSVDFFNDNESLTVLMAAIGILFPLSSLRDVSALSKASAFCFVSAFFLIVVMAYEFAEDRDTWCDNETQAVDPNASEASSGSGELCSPEWGSIGKVSVFSVYGIFVFTKACHHTEFQIYRSLGVDATPQLWSFVCRMAIVLCSIITSTCAMMVYGIFGTQVEDDFFKSFTGDNTVVSIGRLMFTCLIMMSFPMQLFVSRETLQIMIDMYISRNVSSEERDTIAAMCDGEHVVVASYDTHAQEETPQKTTRQSTIRSRVASTLDRRSRLSDPLSAAGGDIRGDTSNLMHFSTTALLFLITFGIGMATDSLGKVLGLVGGVAGSLIAFFLPGMIGFHSYEKTGIHPILGRRLAGFTAVFGVATILITSVFTFVSV